MGLVACSFFVSLIFMQHVTNLPVDMGAQGLSAQWYGQLIAINPVMIVLFQPSVGQLLQRLDRLKVLASGAALMAVGFGLNGLASGRIPLYAAGVVIWTIGEMFVLPTAPAVVAELAPEHARGRYQGTYQVSWGASNMLGPLAGAYLLQTYGSSALWGACLAMGLLAAAGFLGLAQPIRRRALSSTALARELNV